MKKVLFVSVGNICRSPMGEAIFRHLVKEAGLEAEITVDSAGTDDWHIGERPHLLAYDLLVENGIKAEDLVSREITAEDLAESDYLIAPDAEIKAELEGRIPENFKGEIIRLMDLVPKAEKKDILDPFYIGYFDEVYDLVYQGCTALLTYIQDK